MQVWCGLHFVWRFHWCLLQWLDKDNPCSWAQRSCQKKSSTLFSMFSMLSYPFFKEFLDFVCMARFQVETSLTTLRWRLSCRFYLSGRLWQILSALPISAFITAWWVNPRRRTPERAEERNTYSWENYPEAFQSSWPVLIREFACIHWAGSRTCNRCMESCRSWRRKLFCFETSRAIWWRMRWSARTLGSHRVNIYIYIVWYVYLYK